MPPDTNKSDQEEERWPDQKGQVAPGRTPEEPHTEPLSEGVHPELTNMEWRPEQKPGEALPRTRVRPQRQGPGGSKQKNSQN